MSKAFDRDLTSLALNSWVSTGVTLLLFTLPVPRPATTVGLSQSRATSALPPSVDIHVDWVAPLLRVVLIDLASARPGWNIATSFIV